MKQNGYDQIFDRTNMGKVSQAIKRFFTFVPTTELPIWLDEKEEIANTITHLIGAVLCVPALIMLMISAVRIGDKSLIIGNLVFGLSMNILYWNSSFYHGVNPKKHPKLKIITRYLDHISIYLLIAGSYTPLTLVSMKGTTGYVILGVVWGIALVGTVIKILHFDGFYSVALFLYIGMGWIVIFSIKDLIKAFSKRGLYWLVIGGIFYTIGCYFFSKDTIVPFFHAVWHLYVLMGSVCHFIVVYFYCYSDKYINN